MSSILDGPDREGPEWDHDEPPLTEKEIAMWLDGLAPTDTQRATRIKELLKYAGVDGMSLRDKVICHSCLRRLETKSGLKGVR